MSLRATQGPQAARTNIKTASLPTQLQQHPLDIGIETPVGGSFGVTHIVSKLGPLAADFAFGHEIITSIIIHNKFMIPQNAVLRNDILFLRQEIITRW